MISEKRRLYLKEYRKSNREKMNSYYRKWRKKNWSSYYNENKKRILERAAPFVKAWMKTERGKESMKRYYKKRNLKDKDKVYARHKIQSLIHEGRLDRKPCEVCGDMKSHAHHNDYSKPLEVSWLCLKHHSELHKNIKESSITS